MKIYKDFRMNYLLTVDLVNGATLQKEYDGYNDFRRMYNYIENRCEDYENPYIDLPGGARVRADCIVGMKGEYVEYLLED